MAYKEIDVMENNLLVTEKSYEKGNQVRLYLASNPCGCLGVETWEEFYNKYQYQLETMFPECELIKLKKFWIDSISCMICCFPERFNVSLEGVTLSRVKNMEKWIQENDVRIAQVNLGDVFALMHLMMNTDDIMVAVKGQGTKFYKEILDGEPNPKGKNLSFVLRNAKTQYTSPHKPDDADRLRMQLLFWMFEQKHGFIMTTEIINLLRELKRTIFKKMKRDIINLISSGKGVEEKMIVTKWCCDANKELMQMTSNGDCQ